MRKLFKNIFVAFPLIFSLGCSGETINQTDKSNINKLIVANNSYVVNLSDKKGADFSVSLKFEDSLKVKANSNGVPAKQPSDITKVDIFLLKLPANFAGTDPLGTDNANVAISFISVAKTGPTFNILFKNVPGLAAPNQYWVGVVAKDTNDKVISKAPATAWTGGTTITPALALSTNGIGIDPVTLAVSSTNDFFVKVNLLDTVGADIGANANVSGGNTALPDSNIGAH